MKKVIVMSVCLLLLLSSCTTFIAKGLNYGNVPTNVDRRDYFEEKVWVDKFLGMSGGRTLANVSQERTARIVEDICNRVLAKYPAGSAIEDLQVAQEASFGHLLINWITLYIYAPSYVTVKGYVVVPRVEQSQSTTSAPSTANT